MMIKAVTTAAQGGFKMDNLLTFTNEEFGNIRTVEEDGKIYFCGKDVALSLGYKDSINALKSHCRKDGVVIRHLTDNLGRMREAKFIDEGNLYRLITHSKLPTAEKFEAWIFDEVLPEIRETGQYIRCATAADRDSAYPLPIFDAKDYIQAAKLIAHCPKDRLRIVINLLEHGGLDMSDATDNLKFVDTGDISLRISEAMRVTGLGVREVAEYCGISKEVLRGYYRMRRYPRPDRYLELVDSLNELTSSREVICE